MFFVNTDGSSHTLFEAPAMIRGTSGSELVAAYGRKLPDSKIALQEEAAIESLSRLGVYVGLDAASDRM